MRRYFELLYPLLFAASVVLAIAARGVGQFEGADLLLVTALAVLVAAAALGLMLVVVRLAGRSDRAEPLAATLTMLFVAWFFFYTPAQRAVTAITWRFSRPVVVIPLGILATVAIVVWLLRQPARRLTRINEYMTRFGVILVAVVAAQSALTWYRAPSKTRASRLVNELAQPVRVAAPPPAERNTPKRDIYLIVLDGHLNSQRLREVLQYDNASFDDSLRALGFTVPRAMRSNYTQTILSVPSLLNATLLTQLAEDAGPNNPSFALPKYLVENNRAARFLKSQGYKYVLFPSAWWTGSQHSPIADSEFDARPEFDLRHEMRRTELRRAVVKSTLLGYMGGVEVDALFDVRSMAGLRRMAADSAPTFVFAHFLLPHIPYYLDEQCRVLPNPIVPGREGVVADRGRAAYIAQLRCVDRMTLDVVTTLLRDSRPEPVILIVGDHGSRFADPFFMSHPDSVSTAFIRERFGAFGAFHLPAGGDSAFVESVSLVNVMGNVLRYYFNAALPPTADTMYVSGELPFRFYAVDTTGYVAR
ncbi:MAG TPA: hypothetical protein VGP25_19780 [Gemmatimonadaceae bacterium]|nr:hypothetical protein [Gemmatimonadaceae bacterium]